MQKPATIDEYIAQFPEDVAARLEELRAIVRAAVPAAEEAISYGMPAFKLNGIYLVYMGGYTRHVSLYPTPAGDEAFDRDLAPYKAGKGTAQFKLRQPLPQGLITQMIHLLERDNALRALAKKRT